MGTGGGADGKRASDLEFERLALPWLPDVARFALSLTRSQADADDLVQETYLHAYRSWHTFIPGSDPRRWLFTICKNDFLRSRERAARIARVEAEADAEAETVAAVMGHVRAQDAGYGDLFARLDLAPAIDGALGELPDVYRVAVVLVDVEGYSYEEAAAMLKVPIGTVRSRLFRGRRLLQERLIDLARESGIVGPAAGPAGEAG